MCHSRSKDSTSTVILKHECVGAAQICHAAVQENTSERVVVDRQVCQSSMQLVFSWYLQLLRLIREALLVLLQVELFANVSYDHLTSLELTRPTMIFAHNVIV